MPKPASGFTLIELMVVIAIIAILATVGITVYSSVSKSVRDSRRKADIDALANAFETHKGDSSCTVATNGNYCFSNQNGTDATWLQAAKGWFSGGVIPQDPILYQTKCGVTPPGDGYNDMCWYCVKSGITPGYCSAADGYVTDNLNTIWGGSIGTVWMICANLETGSTGYYCRRSQQ